MAAVVNTLSINMLTNGHFRDYFVFLLHEDAERHGSETTCVHALGQASLLLWQNSGDGRLKTRIADSLGRKR